MLRKSCFPLISLCGLWLCSSNLIAQPCQKPAKRHTAIDPQPQTWSDWKRKHRKLSRALEEESPNLLFLGDSITENWSSIGKSVWDEYYSSRRAMNMGISGDRTQHLLWRIANGGFERVNPRAVVLLIGTNNIKEQRNEVNETTEGVLAVAEALVDRLPETTVLVLGILPCGETDDSRERTDAAAVNRRLEKELDHGRIVFLDVSNKFVDSNGTISPKLMPDHLHLTNRGYKLLAESIEPHLQSILEDSVARQHTISRSE